MAQAGVDSPWLTALILLERTSGIGREAVLAHPESVPTPLENQWFWELVERRCSREPLAYIVGFREFFGRRFAVTRDTLIPRPETEGIVQLALDQLSRIEGEARSAVAEMSNGGEQTPALLLDVGTGSGAIAVTLLDQKPHLRAVATDIDDAALRVASLNAREHGVSARLQLVACDLAEALRVTFPLIVANLPYIPTSHMDALEPEVSRYEPMSALDGGPYGTAVMDRLLATLPGRLAPRGCAILEIGEHQAGRLRKRASQHLPGWPVTFERDAADIERFLVISRPET
ncbi:MAG: prmC [Chloroflexi bacterium]|nr:prmC [Chloroflexota bacterium]